MTITELVTELQTFNNLKVCSIHDDSIVVDASKATLAWIRRDLNVTIKPHGWTTVEIRIS